MDTPVFNEVTMMDGLNINDGSIIMNSEPKLTLTDGGLIFTDDDNTVIIGDDRHKLDAHNTVRLREKTIEILNKNIDILKSLKKHDMGQGVNEAFDAIIQETSNAIDVLNEQPIEVVCQYDKKNNVFVLKISDTAYKYACGDLIRRLQNEPLVKEGKTEFDKLAAAIQLIVFDELTDTD